MTASLLLLTSLAGGLGAVCRLVLDGMIRSGLTPHSGSPAEQTRTLPWPTITINLSGSLVLGVVVGLTLSSTLPSGWDVVVGSGFLGGFTTFSTACVEAVRLAQGRAVGGGRSDRVRSPPRRHCGRWAGDAGGRTRRLRRGARRSSGPPHTSPRPHRVWCDSCSPYTGVSMPSNRALSCSARYRE